MGPASPLSRAPSEGGERREDRPAALDGGSHINESHVCDVAPSPTRARGHVAERRAAAPRSPSRPAGAAMYIRAVMRSCAVDLQPFFLVNIISLAKCQLNIPRVKLRRIATAKRTPATILARININLRRQLQRDVSRLCSIFGTERIASFDPAYSSIY